MTSRNFDKRSSKQKMRQEEISDPVLSVNHVLRCKKEREADPHRNQYDLWTFRDPGTKDRMGSAKPGHTRVRGLDPWNATDKPLGGGPSVGGVLALADIGENREGIGAEGGIRGTRRITTRKRYIYFVCETKATFRWRLRAGRPPRIADARRDISCASRACFQEQVYRGCHCQCLTGWGIRCSVAWVKNRVLGGIIANGIISPRPWACAPILTRLPRTEHKTFPKPVCTPGGCKTAGMMAKRRCAYAGNISLNIPVDGNCVLIFSRPRRAGRRRQAKMIRRACSRGLPGMRSSAP